MADDRELKNALSQIEKQFGSGSIMTLGKNSANKEISVIKTGAISLDAALGVGGVPRGRIIEIYGPESSGKST
jgi:recombination protein RecA